MDTADFQKYLKSAREWVQSASDEVDFRPYLAQAKPAPRFDESHFVPPLEGWEKQRQDAVEFHTNSPGYREPLPSVAESIIKSGRAPTTSEKVMAGIGSVPVNFMAGIAGIPDAIGGLAQRAKEDDREQRIDLARRREPTPAEKAAAAVTGGPLGYVRGAAPGLPVGPLETGLAGRPNPTTPGPPNPFEHAKAPVGNPSASKDLAANAAWSRELAIEGVSDKDKRLVNTALAGADMLLDVGMSGLTGIPFLANIGVKGGAAATVQALDEGYSAPRSLMAGVGSGLITAGVESLGGVGGHVASKGLRRLAQTATGQALLSKIPQKVLKYLETASGSGAGKWLATATAESAENWTEYDLQRVYSNLLLDKDVPRDVKQQAESALAGFLFGGIFGAGRFGRQIVQDVKGSYGNVHGVDTSRAARPRPLADHVSLPDGMKPVPEKNIVTSEHYRPTQKQPDFLTEYNNNEAIRIRSDHPSYRNVIANRDISVGDFFDKWKYGRGNKKFEKLYLGKATPEALRQISDLLGYELSDRNFIISNDDVKHIAKNHGDLLLEEQRGQTAVDRTIFEKLPEIIKSPDNIHLGDLDKSGKAGIVFEKNLGNGVAVYLQFDNAGRGTLQGKTLYITKTKDPTSTGKSARTAIPLTSETIEPESFVGSIIPESGLKSNRQRTHFNAIAEAYLNKEKAGGVDAASGLGPYNTSKTAADGISIPGFPEKSNAQSQEARDFIRATLKPAEDTQLSKVKQSYQDVKALERNAEKVSERNPLNAKEQKLLSALLKDKIDLADIRSDPNTGYINMNYLERVFAAKRAVQLEKGKIEAFDLARRAELDNTAQEAVSNADQWKDKGTGLQYARETMERNFRDVIPDKAEADALIREYVDPVRRNEAASTRFKNEYRNRLRGLSLNKYERVFTQLLGEYEYHSQNTRSAKSKKLAGDLLTKLESLQEKYGNEINEDRCKSAVKVFRGVYDELFEKINDALIQNGYKPIDYREGYFPHFQKRGHDEIAKAIQGGHPDTSGEVDPILKQIGKLLGFDFDAQELPTDIAGLTQSFRPGKKWVGNFLARRGEDTAYDAAEGFDRYIEGVADVIHHTGDIQKLRALERSLRYKYSDAGMQAEIDEVRKSPNLTPEEKEIKLGALFERDPAHLPHLAQEIKEYTNILAGKKSSHDRSAESDTGRRIYEVARVLENRVAANMVALNPGSWLTNFIPLAQGGAEISPASMLKATEATLASVRVDDGFSDLSDFLTNRKGSDPLVKGRVREISDALSKPMYLIDNFTANVLTRGRTYDNIKKGMPETEAIREADRWVASVMADRSKGSLPTLFNRKNPLTRLFTMFQLEVNNQLSHLLKDIPREQGKRGVAMVAGTMLKYFVFSFLYNEMYEKLTGRRSALDPIGIVKQAAENFTNDGMKTSETMGKTGENIAEQLPFIGGVLGGGRVPIQSAIPNVPQFAKLADSEVAGGKKMDILTKELAKPLLYLGLPFGGGQIKKVIEGISAVNNGGSYITNSQGERMLQFPAFDQTPANYAKNILFGKYSSDEAQRYVDDGFRPLPVKATSAYEALAEDGIDRRKAYDTVNAIRDIKDAEGQRDYIMGLNGITPEQKSLLDELLVGELKRERDYSSQDAFKLSALDDGPQKLYSYPSVQKAVGSVDNYIKVRKILGGVKGDKDEYGNTIGGSAKPKQLAEIARQLGVSGEKAASIYNEIRVFSHSMDELDSGTRAKADEMKGRGLSEQRFLEVYNQMELVTSDVDARGKTIAGSLKQNRYNRLRGLGMNDSAAKYFMRVMYNYA